MSCTPDSTFHLQVPLRGRFCQFWAGDMVDNDIRDEHLIPVLFFLPKRVRILTQIGRGPKSWVRIPTHAGVLGRILGSLTENVTQILRQKSKGKSKGNELNPQNFPPAAG